MDETTRRNTLQAINGLPPVEYLRGYCDTTDQQLHWANLKLGYTYLRRSLQAFFAGEADPEFEDGDPVFWATLRDWYLALYTVVQSGWKEICKELTKDGLDKVLAKDGLDIANSSPGQAFIRILEDDCAAAFSICLQPYYKATPTEDREWARLEYKLATGSDERKKAPIAKKLGAIANRRATPIAQYLYFRLRILEICENSKSPTTRNRYRDFMRKQGDLDRYVQSLNHPNKKRRGGTWVKGHYTSM